MSDYEALLNKLMEEDPSIRGKIEKMQQAQVQPQAPFLPQSQPAVVGQRSQKGSRSRVGKVGRGIMPVSRAAIEKTGGAWLAVLSVVAIAFSWGTTIAGAMWLEAIILGHASYVGAVIGFALAAFLTWGQWVFHGFAYLMVLLPDAIISWVVLVPYAKIAGHAIASVLEAQGIATFSHEHVEIAAGTLLALVSIIAAWVPERVGLGKNWII